MSKFYLTTPIYYPNARPHVGSAYTTIVCDVIARYRRMCGDDVAFLTGTDEHGEKLQRAAAEAGMSPGEFVASKRQLFKNLWRFLNISDYKFVHTSQNPDHVRAVQWMLRLADKNGYIEKKKYEGRYCVSDERYISDGAELANCDVCGRPAELISEENYFFKLSAFQQKLIDLYQQHPEFVRPEFRMNEVKSFVKSGLRDISVSRKRIQWGIPWPDDPEQVFYVWYDALTSYMTGIGFQSGDSARKAEFEKYWPADLHMIGKDILRFHAVYWPAFLMAAEMPLPKTVFAHGWIYYEEDKMSKSKGNVVYPQPIVEALDSFGAPGNDALRYYLLREATFGQDMSFSYDALIQRYNSDLANDLGNLASRTVKMIEEYCKGLVPNRDPRFEISDNGTSALKARVQTDVEGIEGKGSFTQGFDRYQLAWALDIAWGLVAEANRYLVRQAPWKVFKSMGNAPVQQGQLDEDGNPVPILSSEQDRRTLDSVLYTAVDILRIVAVLTYPVLPQSAEKLWKQLGCEGELEHQRVDEVNWGGLKPGTKVGKPEPIFPRLDKEATLAKLHELAEANFERDKPKEATKIVLNGKSPDSTPLPSPEPRAPSPESKAPTPDSPLPTPAVTKISIEDFAKVEMRVGDVVSAERVANAQKLLKLMVDIGTEVRQVVAGIAEHYEPEKLIGMKVVVVTNLQPRKLRGVESNGMIVAASAGDAGRPVLVTFKEEVPKGARLK